MIAKPDEPCQPVRILEFTHFSKPTKRFIEECIYGIQALGDTKRSSIVRAIDDDIKPFYTEKRLSRNLNNDKFSLLLMTDMQLHASAPLPKMRIRFGTILSLLIRPRDDENTVYRLYSLSSEEIAVVEGCK